MNFVPVIGQDTKRKRAPLLHLPIAAWPQIDRDLLERAFSVPKDLFSDFGNGHHLKPATKRAITFGYRRWLGWLACHHPQLLAMEPPDRPEPRLVREYFNHLRQTNFERSVATQARWLYDAFRFMSPERNWSWLRTLKARLERAIPKAGRRPVLINSQRLIDAGFAVMDAADTKLANPETRPSERRFQAIALLYRNGLLVSLAGFLVLRRRNLANLFIGTTLRCREGVWMINIPGDEVKNGEPFLVELPTWLGERVDHFLVTYRPLIYRSSFHIGLWASAKGRSAKPEALYKAFRVTVFEALQLSITLHDVRSIAGTTWAIHDPVNVAGAKDLLGDRSDSIFHAHYNLASGIEASRAMANIVGKLKSIGTARLFARSNNSSAITSSADTARTTTD